jgi:hypothetical protein
VIRSGDAIAPPEPEEIDETRSMELRHLPANARLRGRPSGDERCANRMAVVRECAMRIGLGELSHRPNVAAALTHPQTL